MHIEAELYEEAAPSPQPVAQMAAALDGLERGTALTLDVHALEAMHVRLQALSGAVTDRLLTALKQQNECSSGDGGSRLRPAEPEEQVPRDE